MSIKIMGVPRDGIQGFTQKVKTDSVSMFLISRIHAMLAEIRTIFIPKLLPLYLYARPVGIEPVELVAEIPNMIEPEPA